MRAPVIAAKLEMRISVIGNALLYIITIASAEAFVSLESLAVNADFPADAATVLAPIGDTFKAFIILGCVQFHNSFLSAPSTFLGI